MTIEEAERFATEADKLNADLEYVEAATKNNVANSGSRVQPPGPTVVKELESELQREIKEIQKSKRRRKMKVKVERALQVAEDERTTVEGRAAPERTPAPEGAPAPGGNALQEETLSEEGNAIKEMEASQKEAPAAASNTKPGTCYTPADDTAVLELRDGNNTRENAEKTVIGHENIGSRLKYKELITQNGSDTAPAATQERQAIIEESTIPAERPVQTDSAPKKEALLVEEATEMGAAAKRQATQEAETPQQQQFAKETIKMVGHLTKFAVSDIFH